MSKTDMTITLPFSEKSFWIVTVLLAVIALSVMFTYLGVDRAKNRKLPEDWQMKTVAGFTGIFAPIWALLVLLVIYALWEIAWAFGGELNGDELRWHVLALVGLLTALGGLLGTPLALLRVTTTERQVRAAEEGLITDRINKAVEGLGAEKSVKRDSKEWTEPNIEVRIGALYALERIMQDSERDHIHIVELLCAYIRNNAPIDLPDFPEDETDGVAWHDWRSDSLKHPRLDVDVALKVLENRSKARRDLETSKEFRLVLERSSFAGLILMDREFQRANLRGAEMQGANLSWAKMQGADLSWAKMQGANLYGAKMQGADLYGAKMQGANLSWAKMQGANLYGAKMQGANLYGAKMQGANLYGAKMQGANLYGAKMDIATNLTAATLQGAAVRFVDFAIVPQFKEHLESVFGDRSTTLPDDWDWPEKWPNYEMDNEEFETEWEKFKVDPKGYTPPLPPNSNAG